MSACTPSPTPAAPRTARTGGFTPDAQRAAVVRLGVSSLSALRPVGARGEGEEGGPFTPMLLVVAASLSAGTGATKQLGARGGTGGHRLGSSPPCATRG